jgi:hypothetical protein
MAQSAETFVARKVFVRGWCAFEDEARLGLKTRQCLKLWQQILPHLSPEKVGWLAGSSPEDYLSADRYMNRQVVLELSDGAPSDAAAILACDISAAIKEQHIGIPSRPDVTELYATDDKPLWRKRRNALLKKAELVLLSRTPANMRLKTHWPSGTLYLEDASGSSTYLGQAVVDTTSWAWDDSACARFFGFPMPSISLS